MNRNDEWGSEAVTKQQRFPVARKMGRNNERGTRSHVLVLPPNNFQSPFKRGHRIEFPYPFRGTPWPMNASKGCESPRERIKIANANAIARNKLNVRPGVQVNAQQAN